MSSQDAKTDKCGFVFHQRLRNKSYSSTATSTLSRSSLPVFITVEASQRNDPERFILTEAEEQESERGSSDNEEAQASKEIPTEYSLPSATSSSHMERVVRRLEEAIHLRFRHFNKTSTIEVATSAPRYAGSSVTIDENVQRAASMPPTAFSQMYSSRPRRPTSIPPTRSTLEAKLPLMARVLSPATRFTISSDMESPEASSLIFDAALTREGEQDQENEDELESTHWQHSLKSWIERNLGSGGSEAPGFRLFYVRCEREFERSIVERIRADVQHGNIDESIIRSAFPSASPGGIYLQVQSMLPQNTALASYLLTIPGLLYSKSPRVVFPSSVSIPTASARTDLTLPIHIAIEDIESIENIVREPSYLDRYPPHTWIKCKRGLYKDDVGLVVADLFDEVDYDVERLVLIPPRIDWAEVSSGRTSFKRKRTAALRPDILPWKATESIALTQSIPSQLECPQRCRDPDQCLHSEQKRYKCLDQHWQNGLVFIRVRLADMEIASEILPDTRHYFLASNHPDVQQSLLCMPPPSSWEFQIGEAVRFIDYDGGWCTPNGNYTFHLPEGHTEGVIFSVGSLNCEINIPLQGLDFAVHALHTMSKVHLEKIFCPGDTVLISSARHRLPNSKLDASYEANEINLTGREGLILSVGPAKVEVLLQEHNNDFILDFHPNTLKKLEYSVSGHDKLRYRREDYLSATAPASHQDTPSSSRTFTGQVPWKDLHVYSIKDWAKGYRAVVADARLDETTVSGISIRIRYETHGISNPYAWVDYNTLRRADNNRFLHDNTGLREIGSHTEWDSYWSFKTDYHPEYREEELRTFEANATFVASLEAMPEPIRVNTPVSFSPSIALDPHLDPAWDPSSPEPSAQHWILDPRLAQGLQDGMKLLVATSTNPKQDRQVCLRTVDGVLGVYSSEGRKTRNGAMVKIDPKIILNQPRSFTVPPNPAVAKGLYLICSGEQTGLLCRRLSYMMRLDPSKPPRWLVQAVKLIRRSKKLQQFEEYIDMEAGCHWVEANDLVAVHETAAMRVLGNKQMKPMRLSCLPVHEE
ncbi:hypothetical protein FB446DRAFT_706929 [Lentinula raphanica]|nr:hypothetical protein FB446DRAFT_706929 [Lentinula raphanica]